MTVLLTDSIDFSQFLGREISPKVTAVCGVFTGATLLYFIATLIMGNQKWNWLKQSYTDLKKNYDGVFDSKDLDEAFNHDEPLKNAEDQYKSIRNKISAVWIALILVLVIFTGILVWQGNHGTAQEQTQDQKYQRGEIQRAVQLIRAVAPGHGPRQPIAKSHTASSSACGQGHQAPAGIEKVL